MKDVHVLTQSSYKIEFHACMAYLAPQSSPCGFSSQSQYEHVNVILIVVDYDNIEFKYQLAKGYLTGQFVVGLQGECENFIF